MLKKDVLSYFDPEKRRVSVTARALGITPGAVSLWGSEDELVPELRARKIHELTNGALQFRPELYHQKSA
jgi:hypothetical protein